MKILLNNLSLNRELKPYKDVGFVPTMGGIHKGHISLIKKSINTCKKTIVSIFINPKQFNHKNDFKTYPSDIKKDLNKLNKIRGINFVYIPKFKDIYNSKRKLKIKINKKDRILCAKFRKGHFEGVLDVMDRLTNLIKPKKIFMGNKDFQQLFLVKNFIEKKFKTKVIGCNTIRDENKLALSSRNYLFDKHDLDIGGIIAKKIFFIKNKIKNIRNKNQYLFEEKIRLEKTFNIKIEYLEHRNTKNLMMTSKTQNTKIFISYFLKGIRLIDNF